MTSSFAQILPLQSSISVPKTPRRCQQSAWLPFHGPILELSISTSLVNLTLVPRRDDEKKCRSPVLSNIAQCLCRHSLFEPWRYDLRRGLTVTINSDLSPGLSSTYSQRGPQLRENILALWTLTQMDRGKLPWYYDGTSVQDHSHVFWMTDSPHLPPHEISQPFV
jgi:hypothetical protein